MRRLPSPFSSATVWLASRSSRRRQLLADAGIDARVVVSEIDDGVLARPDDLSPRAWMLVLAFVKARQVLKQLQRSDALIGDDLILGADTFCIVDDQIMGQPRDADHARDMLNQMRRRAHQTITGVCLLRAEPLRCEMIIDEATVIVGDVTDEQIEQYVRSSGWRGKAGAYNLVERLDDGWPIECDGDPATVMGLPMRQLRQLLFLVATT